MSIDKLPFPFGTDEREPPSYSGADSKLGGLGGLSLSALKGRPGRPPLDSKLQSKDAYRAWVIQGIRKFIVESGYRPPTQGVLITIAVQLGRDGDFDFDGAPAFPAATTEGQSLEQSVSRGKKKLGIGRDWGGGSVGHD